MLRLLRILAAAFALVLWTAPAQARAQSSWDHVDRIVVMGDMHGDYDKFEAMLRDAGLVNARGAWSGGRTHFVQLGDVPDRGPNSRGIIDHLMRLEREAQRAGGRVHALIGNHEAMNVTGDLRYVSAGEYASFTDRNSVRRRDAYYEQEVAALRAHPPAAGLPTFDAAYRAEWDTRHPLGWVEHRIAWQSDGIYGRWILRHNAVIRINDTLFMHGGLGPSFAAADRETLNNAVRAALQRRPLPAFPDILTNEQGPLWYRGFALNPEETERANLDAALAAHGVARIVLGHTKRASMVLPRFGGRVILTDINVPSGFTDPHGYLIIEHGALTAVHRGSRVPMTAATQAESCAYIARVAALDPAGSPNSALSARCGQPEQNVRVVDEPVNGGSAQ